MTTIRFWLLLLAACKPTPAAEPQPVIENVATSDPTSPAGADTVRPPVAEDLATYTKDLPGAGSLEAVIETPLGSLRCELFADKAPLTVANFIGLATGKKAWLDPATQEVTRGKPFYDGLIFHRVIPGFMIQGGDPEGTGAGGPGYRFDDEIAGLTMEPGALAMANAGPKTNGSQFFVMEGSRPDLATKHTIFGTCKELDVVTKITNAPAENDRPKTPVTMRVRISRAGTP
jgi:peptidyl-prolyl cis-trans isomerase A (cyclophilin A)